MYSTPRVLQSIADEKVVPGISLLGKDSGPNKVPINAMFIVAFVVIGFIIVGDINSLAPIVRYTNFLSFITVFVFNFQQVTIPFIFTYACIDYSYFALAQTFDIQTKREERYRIQAQSPLYESRNYGTNDQHENDLDTLFPDRVRHKNLSTSSFRQNNRSNQIQHEQEIVIRDSSNTNNYGLEGDDTDVVTIIQPVRHLQTTISQKTKNWYSKYCNRYISLLGVSHLFLTILL